MIASLFALAAGCGRAAVPLPRDSPPAPIPADTSHAQPADIPADAADDSPASLALSTDILALVDLPSGREFGALPQVWARMDARAPRQPMQVAANLARSIETFISVKLGIPVDAVDLGRPMRLVIMSPAKLPPRTLMAVVRVADPARLESSHEHIQATIRGEYAVIGLDRALALLTPEDIARLTVPAEVAEPEMTVLMGDHLFIDSPLLQASADPQKRAWAEAMRLLSDQCERIIFRAGIRDGVGTITARVVLTRGSRLAELTGGQAPADHALLDMLPASAGTGLLVVGRIHAGPFATSLTDYLAREVQTALDATAARQVRVLLGQLTGAFLVDWASNRDLPKIFLLEVTDSDLVMNQAMALAEKEDPRFAPRMLVHDGVDIYAEHRKTGESSMAAGLDRHVVVVEGRGAEATTRATLDAARGKNRGFEPPALLAAALERSRARGDSVFAFADLTAELDPIPEWLPAEWLPEGARALALGVSFGAHDAVLTLEIVARYHRRLPYRR